MKRKLIVASAFFVAGLLATAAVTLGLLMSLINRPELFSTDRIAGAVEKSLEALGKSALLQPEDNNQPSPEPARTLTATIISKAKQKGIQVADMKGVMTETREYKAVFIQTSAGKSKPAILPAGQPIRTVNDSRRPTEQEGLIYGLLSLQWSHASDEKKRAVAIKILALQQPDGGWSAFPGMPSDPCATGQALYALQESGILYSAAPDSQKALAFLLNSQHADGSWMRVGSDSLSNAKPEMTSAEAETTTWASLALLEALPDKN